MEGLDMETSPKNRFLTCISYLAIATLVSVSTVPCERVSATEPNETFLTATELGVGVLSVSDSLTPGELVRPDTFLGARNNSGTIFLTDDDGSQFGDGTASGLSGVPTNAGAISFAITGKTDTNFAGAHSENGLYEVIIDVFDELGSPIATFSPGISSLTSGEVDEYSFPAITEWISGTYDVNIDNGLAEPSGGDVDFFRFQGIETGLVFTAQTFQPESSLNTFLYQYDSTGSIIAIDDQSGIGAFSLLRGIVPEEGELTFAVSGFGDTFLTGAHTQNGDYSLFLNLRLPADFDSSGTVDQLDLDSWNQSYASNNMADADIDGDSDGIDFLVWQRQLGQQYPLAAIAVPEPSTWSLLLSMTLALRFCRLR